MIKYLLPEMTSRECQAYQVQGGDIMVVPVGSVEVLGPHLPVGGRCFVAEAFSRLLAQEVGGLCLPVTPFSSVRNTFDRPGSVDAPESEVNAYIRAVFDDLFATGFRRILLVTYLDYLRYYIPQEFYEDRQVAAGGIHLEELLHDREGVGQGACVAGALRILGRAERADRIEAENRRLLEEGCPPPALLESLASLLDVGSVGFTYPPGAYPCPPEPGLSGEMGERALRQAARELTPAVESLRGYNEFLARRGGSRGLLWRGWRWPS
ncbi:MAG: creatininase family protein [Armatimonadetes bacterium]|nr:creatininase family protein [Armatimonadota bacterium]